MTCANCGRGDMIAARVLDERTLCGLCYRDETPTMCPTCLRADGQVIYTVILGWECRACRQYRLERHRDPRERREVA